MGWREESRRLYFLQEVGGHSKAKDSTYLLMTLVSHVTRSVFLVDEMGLNSSCIIGALGELPFNLLEMVGIW